MRINHEFKNELNKKIFIGLQNFAKEFDDVLDSKQNVQELFSSSAVAIPLVALASLLLFRAPLTDLLEGINSP